MFGILWAINPDKPYEPLTFLAMLFGGTIVEFFRRNLTKNDSVISVPLDILYKIEVSCSKGKVQEILGNPHRVVSDMWLYRFREALVQIAFYENGAVKSVALALTIYSPKKGFAIPMFDKPLGEITFGDFGQELVDVRHRSTLRTSELLLETRVGPIGAWSNFTFGALSPLAPGMLADVNVPDIAEDVVLSKVAKLRINWVAISESSEEEWFEWSLAIPAMV